MLKKIGKKIGEGMVFAAIGIVAFAAGLMVGVETLEPVVFEVKRKTKPENSEKKMEETE